MPSISIIISLVVLRLPENTRFLTFATESIEANYGANENRFDVLGTDDEITVLIDGQRIDTYTKIMCYSKHAIYKG